jgi:hypothetical protein
VVKELMSLHQIWWESVKGLNSHVAYVSRRVLNSRYTKFDWNRLRVKRAEWSLHHIWLESVKVLYSYVAYVSRRVLNSRYTKFGCNRLRG